MHDIEFAPRAFEVLSQPRVRHTLEIAKRLIQRYLEAQVVRHLPQRFRRLGAAHEVVFKDLDRVETG